MKAIKFSGVIKQELGLTARSENKTADSVGFDQGSDNVLADVNGGAVGVLIRGRIIDRLR